MKLKKLKAGAPPRLPKDFILDGWLFPINDDGAELKEKLGLTIVFHAPAGCFVFLHDGVNREALSAQNWTCEYCRLPFATWMSDDRDWLTLPKRLRKKYLCLECFSIVRRSLTK